MTLLITIDKKVKNWGGGGVGLWWYDYNYTNKQDQRLQRHFTLHVDIFTHTRLLNYMSVDINLGRLVYHATPAFQSCYTCFPILGTYHKL